jgi:hypothetical protein
MYFSKPVSGDNATAFCSSCKQAGKNRYTEQHSTDLHWLVCHVCIVAADEVLCIRCTLQADSQVARQLAESSTAS